jgi:hypothetical protein
MRVAIARECVELRLTKNAGPGIACNERCSQRDGQTNWFGRVIREQRGESRLLACTAHSSETRQSSWHPAAMLLTMCNLSIYLQTRALALCALGHLNTRAIYLSVSGQATTEWIFIPIKLRQAIFCKLGARWQVQVCLDGFPAAVAQPGGNAGRCW